jgi:hypothetical protein
VTGYRLESHKGEVLSAAVVQAGNDEATGLKLPERVTLTFPLQKLEVRLRLYKDTVHVNKPLAGVDSKRLFTPPDSEARNRADAPPAASPPVMPAPPQAAVPQETVVILGDAKITLAPGAQTKIRAVKTAQGGRVRVEVAGTTIEAPRLRVETGVVVIEMEATADGMLQCRSLPRPQP